MPTTELSSTPIPRSYSSVTRCLTSFLSLEIENVSPPRAVKKGKLRAELANVF